MELRKKVAAALARRNYPGATDADIAEMAEGFVLDADAAIAAVLDAMGEPSEAVWSGLPRDLIMWMDMEPKTPRGLFRHLKLCRGHVPEWLTKEPEMGNLDHVVSKGSRAVLVWKAMLAAFRTEALPPDSRGGK